MSNLLIHPEDVTEQHHIISTGYTPRAHQQILHNKFKRFNVVVAHRRFGKTVCTLNEMLDKALNCTLHNPHYAYIAPTYGQAEKIAWEYIKDFAGNIPGFRANEGKLRITVNRPAIVDRMGKETRRADTITIWLLGAEKPDSIRGMYMDGVILDEYGEMNPAIWTTVVRQCLMDRKGWAIFIGTPKGRNEFFNKYKYALEHEATWHHDIFKASDTGILDPEELELAKEELTDDEYNQEMECSFTASLTGFYLSKRMSELREKGRLGQVPHNPAKPVATFWDLGLTDDMTVWFVQLNETGTGYNIIDYMSDSGYAIDWWWKRLKALPYNFSRHYWPHDGGRREIVTGKERWLIAEELGMRPIEIVPKPNRKSESIDAIRTILPMCTFDESMCEKGIYCLENWQREWDAKNKRFKDKPKHDWASHGADGFSTFALGVDMVYSFTDTLKLNSRKQSFADSDWDVFEE